MSESALLNFKSGHRVARLASNSRLEPPQPILETDSLVLVTHRRRLPYYRRGTNEQTLNSRPSSFATSDWLLLDHNIMCWSRADQATSQVHRLVAIVLVRRQYRQQGLLLDSCYWTVLQKISFLYPITHIHTRSQQPAISEVVAALESRISQLQNRDKPNIMACTTSYRYITVGIHITGYIVTPLILNRGPIL